MVDPDQCGELFDGELQQLRQKVKLLQADREFMREEIQRLQSLGNEAHTGNGYVRQTEELERQLQTTSAELATQRTLSAKLGAKLQLAARALQLQKYALDDIRTEVASCRNGTAQFSQCIEEHVVQLVQSMPQDAAARISALEQQVATLHSDLSSQELENQTRIATLKSSHNDVQMQLAKMEVECRTKQAECAEAHGQLEMATTELQRVRQQFSSAEASLGALNEQLRAKLQEVQERLENHRARTDKAERQVEELRQEKEKLITQLSQQSRANQESLTQQEQQHANEMNQIHITSAGKDSRIAALESTLESLEAEVAKLRAQLTQSHSTLEGIAQQRDDAVAALEQQIQDLTANLDQCNNKCAAQQSSLENISKSAAMHQAEAQTAKSSLSLLQSRFWQLTQESDTLKETLAATRLDRDKLASLCPTLKTQLTETERQKQEAEGALTRHEEVVKELQRLLQEQDQSSKVAELNSAVETLQSQLQDKHAELEQLQQMVISQCAERNSLLDELSQMKSSRATPIIPAAVAAATPAPSNLHASKSGMLSNADDEATNQRVYQQATKHKERKYGRDSRIVPV